MNQQSALHRLLNLESYTLTVFRDVGGKICVHYSEAYIQDGICLSGDVGRGATVEEACENYMQKISGKVLVFNPENARRKEIRVL